MASNPLIQVSRGSNAAWQIRRARVKDSQTLARMVAALFDDSVRSARDPFTRSHIPKTLIEVAKWFRALSRDESAVVLVAETAGQLVGFIKGHRQAPYVESSGIAEVGYLSMVWVDPAYRRSGVGRSLVREAEAAFRAQGLRHVELHYLFGNSEAAAAWARMGYTPYRIGSFKTLV